MRPFIDYVQDRMYDLAKSFAKPDYFMSFTEATWQTTSPRHPNGIPVFPILDTMHLWIETEYGHKFQRVSEQKQNKLYILRSVTDGNHYTEDDFQTDYRRLQEQSDLKPNVKLINNYERLMEGKDIHTQKEIERAIDKEENKFAYMFENATRGIRKPNEKLLRLTQWLAAGGKNPNENFNGNASQRWTNILRRLGYSALEIHEMVIFFSTNDLEVIDEIHN